MIKLKNDLERNLGIRKYSKTVIFAVKMFGYSCRIIFREFIVYPFEIDIPLDSRIIKFTQKFTNKDFLGFWRDISIKSGVPPLHIDSILWPFLSNREIYDNRLKNLIEFLDKVYFKK